MAKNESEYVVHFFKYKAFNTAKANSFAAHFKEEMKMGKAISVFFNCINQVCDLETQQMMDTLFFVPVLIYISGLLSSLSFRSYVRHQRPPEPLIGL